MRKYFLLYLAEKFTNLRYVSIKEELALWKETQIKMEEPEGFFLKLIFKLINKRVAEMIWQYEMLDNLGVIVEGTINLIGSEEAIYGKAEGVEYENFNER